jgi:signal transduction histidine kinase
MSRTERKMVMIVYPRPGELDPIPEHLEAAGYSVLICTDVGGAMESLDSERPDLVIMAMHLEGIRGVQVMDLFQSSIKETVPSVPVLVIGKTHLDPRLAESLAVQHGAYAFVPLPCEPERILHMVDLMLCPERVPEPILEQWKRRGAIYVVDDDPGVLRLLKAALQRNGSRVETFLDPLEFVEQFRRYRPRVVLLDYSLPGKSGLDVLVELQEIDPTVPVVLFTGKGSEEVATKAFRLGAADYLRKPLDLPSLPRSLQRAVEKHQSVLLTNALEQNLMELDRKTVELAQAMEELAALNKFKSSLLAAAGHDMRAPLVSMISGSETLQEFFADEIPDEAMHIISSQHGAAYRLLTVLNNLLDMEQVEQGAVPLELGATSMAVLLEDCVRDMSHLAASNELELIFEQPADSPKVMMDREKIARVIYNLLANAIKYNRRGGRIQVSMTVSEGKVRVDISDTGQGIPEEEIERVFEKFRVWRHGKGSSASTGLGLFLCRQFVESHGGEIWVESRLDEGSTFSFTLPILGPSGPEQKIKLC